MKQSEFRAELVKIMPGYNWTVHKSHSPDTYLIATGIQSSGSNRLSTLRVERREAYAGSGSARYEVKSAGYGRRAPWLHIAADKTLARALRALQDHYERTASLYWSHAGHMKTGRKAVAAAPGKAQHSVPEGYALIPTRETEAMHDAVMALLYKGVARTDTQKLLDAYIAAAPGKEVPQAWHDVQAERRRQIEAEGWTPEHDDQHSDGQMAQAAGCYALHAGGIGTDWPGGIRNGSALFWPWDEEWWKPSTARRDMVKACALGLAEIERLDRVAASQGGPSDA
ncbi:hypothetical protein [Pseudomonas aeruginosa]|uniref:hypothetical protein n=1 Tax=Pseudomonas aeruginosa TaxID=287 RepID=UPI0016A3BC54|nr:hypothetical protein [Pseudomonas aeruginosa]NNB83637.1 hypothetical protein [Pseudomonas aeruginosa]